MVAHDIAYRDSGTFAHKGPRWFGGKKMIDGISSDVRIDVTSVTPDFFYIA